MTITLKIYFAGEKTKTMKKGDNGKITFPNSKFGHVWFSLEGEKNSYGWGVEDFRKTSDNFLEKDNKTYLGSIEHQIAEFSLTISLDQAQKLKNFARKVDEGQKVDGFGQIYNVFTNNCIHFVARALIEAGLLEKDFKVQNNHAPITQMPLIMQGIQDRHLAQGNHQYVENLRWYSQTKEGVQTTHKEIKKVLDVQAQTLTIQDANGVSVKDLREPVTYQDGDAWGHLMNSLGLNISVGDIRLPDDPSMDPYWQQAWTWSKRRSADPIVLDLDGDGVDGLGQWVYFDHGGDGFAELTGWVDPGDGLLVRDLDKDGKITSGAELFGNYTLLKSGSYPWHGFEAMKDIDSNQDKVLNSQDAAWNELKVWKDANSNGETEAGELLTLEEAGVQEIDISPKPYYHHDPHLNYHPFQSQWTDSSGKKHQLSDAWFVSTFWKTGDRREQLEALFDFPNLKATGNLGSLHQAAARSPEIQTWINRYLQEKGIPERAVIMEEVMKAWGRTGAKDYDYSDMSHYNLVDQAKFIVRMMGEDHVQTFDLGFSQRQVIEDLFKIVRNRFMAQLDAQTHDQKYYQSLKLVWNGQGFDLDASGIAAQLRTAYESDRMQGVAEIARLGHRLTDLKTDKILQAISREAKGESEFDLLLKAMPGSQVGSHANDVMLIPDPVGSILVSYDGNDVLRGNQGNDRIYAGNGETNLLGREGDDHLEGGSFRNYLYGGQGNDTLLGKEGGDSLFGDQGDDILLPGNDRDWDRMDGCWGSDTYILEKQWGQDSLFERTDWEGKDRLIFSQHKGEELWFSQGYFGLRINPVGNRQDILEITIPEGIEEIASKDGKVLKVEDARKLAQKMDVYQNHNFFVPEDVQVEVMGSNVELKALVIESWV